MTSDPCPFPDLYKRVKRCGAMWSMDIFSQGFPHHLLLQLLLCCPQSRTPEMPQAPDKHAGCAASVAMATTGRQANRQAGAGGWTVSSLSLGFMDVYLFLFIYSFIFSVFLMWSKRSTVSVWYFALSDAYWKHTGWGVKNICVWIVVCACVCISNLIFPEQHETHRQNCW